MPRSLASNTRNRCRLTLETLEDRLAPAGYSPAQIRHAYGFDQLPAANDGSGVTIAIVIPYSAPGLASDLNTFSSAYGLPQFNTAGGPTFTAVNQYGGSVLPPANSAWNVEAALDAEWAHAIAPQANILMVEANTDLQTDCLAAADYAGGHAAVVSMSFGAAEAMSETRLDAMFQRPGVSFVATVGDTGGALTYPAASPYVLAVGGTNLALDAAGNRTGAETAWSSSGGGISQFEPEPGYQSSLPIPPTGSRRGTPDVAYDADPATGVSVYSTPGGGWITVGGTSVGAPQWAALIALADQRLLQAGKPLLSTGDGSASPIYAAAAPPVYASNFTDITSGGSGPGTQAGVGYDLATGLGTPKANNLVPFLAGAQPASSGTSSGSGSGTGTGTGTGSGSGSGSGTGTGSGTGSGSGSGTPSGPSPEQLRAQNVAVLTAIINFVTQQGPRSPIHLLTLLNFDNDGYVDIALSITSGRSQVILVIDGLTGALLFNTTVGG